MKSSAECVAGRCSAPDSRPVRYDPANPARCRIERFIGTRTPAEKVDVAVGIGLLMLPLVFLFRGWR